MAQKEDRRVTRTRRLLKEALLELIFEKGYDAITVQDILDRADVGRSTFYAHFNSKDDLLIGDAPYLQFGFNDIQDMSVDPEEIPSYLDLFEHVAEHSRLFQALIGGQGVDFVQRIIQKHLYETFINRFNRLQEQGKTLPVPPPVLAQYLTGGMISLVVWWLDEDLPYSPEELDRMFLHMARGAVSQSNGV